MENYNRIVRDICNHLKIRNILGQGISDAQKTLIAAQEIGAVSNSAATKISEELNLGLSWES